MNKENEIILEAYNKMYKKQRINEGEEGRIPIVFSNTTSTVYRPNSVDQLEKLGFKNFKNFKIQNKNILVIINFNDFNMLIEFLPDDIINNYDKNGKLLSDDELTRYVNMASGDNKPLAKFLFNVGEHGIYKYLG